MNEEEWTNFVKEHSESTFFHELGWKKVIENAFGFKPHYLIAKAGQEVLGILPLFEINQKSGKKLISLPFATKVGLLYKTEQARDYLIEQAKELVKEDDFDYLEIRQEKDFETDLNNKDYYCHMKLDITKDLNTIWKRINKKARNAIRKAKKLGLTTDKGISYFDDFYKIFAVNMRDLGTPVDKREFFEEIIKQYPDKVEIVVSKLKEKVIGAVFLLKHKKTVKSEWASSYRKYFGYNASQLAFWQSIENAHKEGYETFDFGRSVLEEGTYRFKKKFAAMPFPLHYKYFINKGTMPDMRKENWKRKTFATAWKHMPLALANRLGPKIRQEFP